MRIAPSSAPESSQVPTVLTHVSPRRPGLVLWGLLIVVVGVWLMFDAITEVRERALVCDPALSAESPCYTELRWLGMTLQERPLADLQVAEVREVGSGHQLYLISTDDSRPFGAVVDQPGSLRRTAAAINAHLAGQAAETLTLTTGGSWQGVLWGVLGSFLQAMGWFLAIIGYRQVRRPSHANVAWSVAFAPDGRMLASAGWDRLTHLWRLPAGVRVHTLAGHTDSVVSLAFSADGRTLASASWDKTVRLWDVEGGTLRHILNGHVQAVVCLAASSDSRFLASGSWDKTIRLWHLGDGTPKHSLIGHDGGVEGLAFTPDGCMILSASSDRTVRLWRLRDGACQRIVAHPEGVSSVAVSPDGRQFATASTDRLIRLWSLPEGGLQGTLSGHTDWVRSLSYGPDGRYLASSGNDGTVRLWSLDEGILLHTFLGHTREVHNVTFSPDGTLLASVSGDQLVRLWPVSSHHFNSAQDKPPVASPNTVGGGKT